MVDSISGFSCNKLILQAIATKGRTATDLSSDTTLRSQLVEALNLIEFDYWGRNDWHFTHSNFTVPIVANTQGFSLANATPATVEKIELLYDKTNNRIIRPANNKIITRADPNENWNSDPVVYSRWGDRSYILCPIPDTSDTLYGRGKLLPTHKSSHTDYLSTPYKYQKTILWELKGWFYDITDDSRAQYAHDRYEQGIIQDWEKDTLELDEAERFMTEEEWLQDPITTSYEDYLRSWFG